MGKYANSKSLRKKSTKKKTCTNQNDYIQSNAPPQIKDIQTLMKNLTHHLPDERQRSLIALINLNTDESQKAMSILYSQEILVPIIKLLQDPIQKIRLSSIQILTIMIQNVSSSSQLPEFLLKNNVLQTVLHILNSIQTQLQNFMNDKNQRPVLDYVSFIKVICQLIQSMVDYFSNKKQEYAGKQSEKNFEQYLVQILNHDVTKWILKFFLDDNPFLVDVSKSMSEFVYAITSESKYACNALLQSEFSINKLESRVKELNHEFIQVQAYICGSLYNIYSHGYYSKKQQQETFVQKINDCIVPFCLSIIQSDNNKQFGLNILPLIHEIQNKNKKMSKMIQGKIKNSQNDDQEEEKEKHIEIQSTPESQLLIQDQMFIQKKLSDIKISQDSKQLKNYSQALKNWRKNVNANIIALQIVSNIYAEYGIQPNYDQEDSNDYSVGTGIGINEGDTQNNDYNEWEDIQQVDQELKQNKQQDFHITNKILFDQDFLQFIFTKLQFSYLNDQVLKLITVYEQQQESILVPIISLKSSAFESLTNCLVFHSIKLKDLNESVVKKIWDKSFDLIKISASDMQLTKSVLRQLKSLVETGELKTHLRLNEIVDDNQLNQIVNFMNVEDNVFRVPVVGLVGSILAVKEHNQEQNKAILQMFLSFSSSDNIQLISQCLNAIFDIYSEETFNQNLKRTDAIKKLKKIQVHLSQMISVSVKRKGNKVYSHLEIAHFKEALFNLKGFINYKIEKLH